MKRLCFGTLLNLMYQARNQGVTYRSICDRIFRAYGCDGMDYRDKDLPSHLKSGHDNVPLDVIMAARNMSFEDAIEAFETDITAMLAEVSKPAFILAVKRILEEDPIPGDTIIGYEPRFNKSTILKSDKFTLAPLLSSIFRYAIVEIANHDCMSDLKGFEKDFVSRQMYSQAQIFIDPLHKSEEQADEEATPLQRTLHDGTFDRVFRKISSVVVSGATHPSTAAIYCADPNNCKLRFTKIKEYLVDNIGTYVFSRSKVNRFSEMKRPVGAIGTQALLKFRNAYGQNAEAMLGELLLYIFLEQELEAPKIMSKVEFAEQGGATVSKSDGIHLLATTEHGRPFNQLVFGASDIAGDLTHAVDRAFDRIVAIEKNSDLEFSMVENTSQYLIFDDATKEYILDIMIPRKQNRYKPDMAFGVFLGYTLVLDPPEKDSALYRVAAERQLQKDIEDIKNYIVRKIADCGLEGYSFYFYVLPFNDAPAEKTSLIDEMLAGGY